MLHGDKHNSTIKIPCVPSYLKNRGYLPSQVTFKYRTLNSNHFILRYEHLLIYLYYISFFFLEIDCNHLQKLPAKTGTLLCHNRWMNWNVPWQREGTYKRDSYIFCLNFSMLTCINTIFMDLLISQHSVETSYCIYTQRRKRKRRNLS